MSYSSGAKKAFGTLLGMDNNDSPLTYSKLTEVTQIKQQGAKYDELDVTHMESPGDTKEFILGLKDGGSIDISVNFTDDAEQEKLRLAQGTRRNFILQFPQLATPMEYQFKALVNAFNYDATPKDKLSATLSLHVVSDLTRSTSLTSWA